MATDFGRNYLGEEDVLEVTGVKPVVSCKALGDGMAIVPDGRPFNKFLLSRNIHDDQKWGLVVSLVSPYCSETRLIEFPIASPSELLNWTDEEWKEHTGQEEDEKYVLWDEYAAHENNNDNAPADDPHFDNHSNSLLRRCLIEHSAMLSPGVRIGSTNATPVKRGFTWMSSFGWKMKGGQMACSTLLLLGLLQAE